MSNFRTIDRQTGFLLPPSVDEWLPEKHLARFVVEVIDGLDLRAMSGSYRGSGSASYHPRMLLGIVVYGYATGVFSSRKLERATYDSVAFRFIAANDHPDHDTIAAFRRRFLKEIEGLFVQVLLLAREMGVLNMGTIGLDGTKIHANASRHMWTAPSSQEPFAVFGSDRLRPYVRPVGALAHERWPRWFPRREFQTQGRPLTASAGYGVSRVVDRSITPSACCLASSGIGSSRSQLSCSPCLADL
jgi:transposase